MKRFLILGLALALLAGCAPAANVPQDASSQPPAVSSSLPDKDEGVQVLTHWDALEPRGNVLPDVEKLWPGGVSDTLIPREDYGPLYPYAGAMVNAFEMGDWGDHPLYGLMTRKGELVTQPVYTGVETPSYYNGAGEWATLPLLLLKKSVEKGGWPYGDGTLLAVAARDGSWCTDARWWTCAAGEGGLILYGPEGCCWMGPEGDILGEWPWDELVSAPEMAAEVMSWERLAFEPAWLGDLVWMGWTDDSCAQFRVLDLSQGQARDETAGEWDALYHAWTTGRGEDYTYFSGADTFDGTCTRLEIGGQSYEIPYGGTDLYCTLEQGLLFFRHESYGKMDREGAVYRLDGTCVVESGTYDIVSIVRDAMGQEGPVLLLGDRPDGSCDLLDGDGTLWMENVPSYLYLEGALLQMQEEADGRQVVSCYDANSLALLYRRTLGLGSDQQEPWDDSMW